LFDWWSDKYNLIEYICSIGGNNMGSINYNCPNGCQDGACIPEEPTLSEVCTDSDGGENYYVQGKTCNNEGSSDKYNLIEYICSIGGNNMGSINYNCPNGCQDGACIPEETIITPTEGTGPVKIPTVEISFVCNGCELNDKCYPMNYRTSKNYCSSDGEFIAQLSAEESCNNNFECKSNVCVSGECVSAGLIKRIINWLKGLFGE
jgi:hypothetical protein